MKTLLLLLSTAFAACAQPAFPTNVTLAARGNVTLPLRWEAGDPDETITNFTVFLGLAPGTRSTNEARIITASGYHARFDTGTNAFLPVTNLGTGTFYGVITATAEDGRTSNPSAEFTFDLPVRRPPPATPKQIKTVSLRVIIRAADSPEGPWTVTTNFPPLLAVADARARHFRAEVVSELGPQISTGR